MKGRVAITDLADREFDIEIPPYLRDSLSLNTELKITFEVPVETNYVPSKDYSKVDLNYKLGFKR